jgi:hypothetical protein
MINHSSKITENICILATYDVVRHVRCRTSGNTTLYVGHTPSCAIINCAAISESHVRWRTCNRRIIGVWDCTYGVVYGVVCLHDIVCPGMISCLVRKISCLGIATFRIWSHTSCIDVRYCTCRTYNMVGAYCIQYRMYHVMMYDTARQPTIS